MAGEDKDFIKEKIIGRNISFKNAVKRILLALICGLVFGAGGALAFFTVSEAGRRFTEAKEAGQELSDDASQEAEAQGTELQEEENSGDVSSDEGAAADGELSDKAEEEELMAKIDSAVKEEMDEYEHSEDSLLKLQQVTEELSAYADIFLTEVHAHSLNTTWFEDTVESSSIYSGIIIDITPADILILTSSDAAVEDGRLSVVFCDGTAAEARLLQSSVLDEAAVIAVAKQGLPQELTADMEMIPIDRAAAVKKGSIIAAVGAPLGRTGSLDLGIVGDISEQEAGPDMRREVFYSELEADGERGSFILNTDGELIGMASSSLSEETGTTAIISTSYLYRVIDRLKNGEPVPYIGIEGAEVSETAADGETVEGVYILSAIPGSPSYEAGIKNGDIVVGIGNTTVSNLQSYENAVRLLKSGDTVDISILRGSANGGYNELSFELTVGRR